jgi:hypothetical protein
LASLSAVTRDLPFGKAIVFRILFWFTALALLLVAWLVWALLRPAMFRRRIERARREFVRVRDSLESAFFSAAAATGKPRGLKWKQCAFQPGVLLARDRANGEFVGLVGVTATRYDKRDENFLASVKLASLRIWLRSYESVT